MFYSIKQTEKYGRGLYASRDIPANVVLDICEVLVLSPEDTIKINETDLKHYTFVYDADSKQDCLVLGDGEIYNHDDNPNVYYRLLSVGPRKVMQFLTSRAVKEGEQLFIDYRLDAPVKVAEYVEVPSLVQVGEVS